MVSSAVTRLYCAHSALIDRPKSVLKFHFSRKIQLTCHYPICMQRNDRPTFGRNYRKLISPIARCWTEFCAGQDYVSAYGIKFGLFHSDHLADCCIRRNGRVSFAPVCIASGGGERQWSRSWAEWVSNRNGSTGEVHHRMISHIGSSGDAWSKPLTSASGRLLPVRIQENRCFERPLSGKAAVRTRSILIQKDRNVIFDYGQNEKQVRC